MNRRTLFAFVFASMTQLLSSAVAMAHNMNQYMDTLKQKPEALKAFIAAMPKGADLHNHLTGAPYAENLIQDAKGEGFCLELSGLSVSQQPNCPQLDFDAMDDALRTEVIDAWSMRNYEKGSVAAHDHFFDSFSKFSPIVSANFPKVWAEVVNRAGQEKVNYLELMETFDANASGKLGHQLGYSDDFDLMRQRLLDAGLTEIVANMPARIQAIESQAKTQLNCNQADKAQAGCKVTVRYLYQVLRNNPPEDVFAQLLAGYMLSRQSDKVVGINMVQPEDGRFAIKDYRLHMEMLAYLNRLYPDVKLSLHAGELNSLVAKPEDLRFHIRDAVIVANAKRIGHGVDIVSEDNYQQTLEKMAEDKRMVEINLSSNDAILGVKGQQHPLRLYMQYGVPVALSTDDEGILRTNLNQEYQRAVTEQDLSYSQLKTLTRNSLQYSFIEGQALWLDVNKGLRVADCRNASLKAITARCQAFLNKSPKAVLQWQLEQQLYEFENASLRHRSD